MNVVVKKQKWLFQKNSETAICLSRARSMREGYSDMTGRRTFLRLRLRANADLTRRFSPGGM